MCNNYSNHIDKTNVVLAIFMTSGKKKHTFTQTNNRVAQAAESSVPPRFILSSQSAKASFQYSPHRHTEAVTQEKGENFCRFRNYLMSMKIGLKDGYGGAFVAALGNSNQEICIYIYIYIYRCILWFFWLSISTNVFLYGCLLFKVLILLLLLETPRFWLDNAFAVTVLVLSGNSTHASVLVGLLHCPALKRL